MQLAVVTRYHPDGVQLRERWYSRNGKRVGLREKWHANGVKALELQYNENGQLYGARSMWWDNGQLAAWAMYENGHEIGRRVGFHPNGQMRYESWSDHAGDKQCERLYNTHGEKTEELSFVSDHHLFFETVYAHDAVCNTPVSEPEDDDDDDPSSEEEEEEAPHT